MLPVRLALSEQYITGNSLLRARDWCMNQGLYQAEAFVDGCWVDSDVPVLPKIYSSTMPVTMLRREWWCVDGQIVLNCLKLSQRAPKLGKAPTIGQVAK